MRFASPAPYITGIGLTAKLPILQRFPAPLRFLKAHDGRGLDADVNEGKPGGIQTSRRAVLVVGELKLAVARAKWNRAAPGQHRIALPDRTPIAVHRLGIAVEPARIAVQVRPQTLAGRHAIPASGDDRAHFDDAERYHHRCLLYTSP